jgi:serine/threonine protein kinase
MGEVVIDGIISMARLAWRTCADAKIYQSECLRIGDRLTVLIVVTQQWHAAATTVSIRESSPWRSLPQQEPSLSALANLQKVLHDLTLILQKATTDRSLWTKFVHNLVVSTSMLDALHQAETALNAALQDFQSMQNHRILQMQITMAQQQQGVEAALLHYAEQRRVSSKKDAPSFLQVMNKVLRDHQQDNGTGRGSVMTSPTTASSTTASLHRVLDDELGIIQASALAIDRSKLRFSTGRGHLLGSGSFGDVYSGFYKGEKVAIKRIRITAVLENEDDGDGEVDEEVGDRRRQSLAVFLARLREEALVMARVGIHPNILHLYGIDLVGDAGGGPATNKLDLLRPILVLELMDATLYAVLHGNADNGQRPLASSHMVGWMKGIASALEFLHLQGIVHGNIKSLNILLTRDLAVAKLSDFGEAKEKIIRSTTVLQSTMINIAVRQQQPQPYHAPEILAGKLTGPSRKADVYAFGVVLWECATRQIPFKGQRDYEIIQRALDVSIPFMLDMSKARTMALWADHDGGNKDDTKVLLRLAQNCMDRSPKLRPHATELIRQFQKQFNDDPVAVVAAGASSPSLVNVKTAKQSSSGTSPRCRCWLWTTVATVLFLVAFGAVVGVYCGLGKCNGPSPPTPTQMPLSYTTSAPTPRATTPRAPKMPAPTIPAPTIPAPTIPAPIYLVPPTIAPMILAPVTPPAPTPTDSVRPTADIASIVSYINKITLSSQTIRYPLSNFAIATPEEQAILWLIEDDRDSAPTNQLALRQRYVLATVWFGSTSWKMPLSIEGTPLANAASYSATWINPGVGECEWHRIKCTSGVITDLEFSGNGEDAAVLGPIPNDLGLLTGLTNLHLYNKTVTGTIPSQLGYLTALTRLRLYSNSLTGTIPSQLGLLTGLLELRLNDNKLTGAIPSQFGALTGLVGLTLPINGLTGTIPSSLGRLTGLLVLSMYTNALTGSIPSELGQLTRLTVLSMFDNDLTGAIPSSLGMLTALSRFHLFDNALSGTVPICPSNELVADCAEVFCSCCTHCCPTSIAGIPVFSECT